MKMNKILLGVTAVLFAAGAAFASVKVSTSSAQMGYYLEINDDPESCTEFQVVNCDLNPSEDCQELVPGHGLKTIYVDPGCDQPLQRENGF